MCTIFDEGKYLVKSGRRKSIDADEWSVVDRVPLFDFQWPMGGMFVWVQMNFQTHPLWKKTTPQKLARALWVHLTTPKYLVLVAPGSIFAPNDEIREASSWKFFRVCFAAVDEPEVERTSRRFVAGVKGFWGKKSLDDIEELEAKGVDMEAGVVDMRGAC